MGKVTLLASLFCSTALGMGVTNNVLNPWGSGRVLSGEVDTPFVLDLYPRQGDTEISMLDKTVSFSVVMNNLTSNVYSGISYSNFSRLVFYPQEAGVGTLVGTMYQGTSVLYTAAYFPLQISVGDDLYTVEAGNILVNTQQVDVSFSGSTINIDNSSTTTNIFNGVTQILYRTVASNAGYLAWISNSLDGSISYVDVGTNFPSGSGSTVVRATAWRAGTNYFGGSVYSVYPATNTDNASVYDVATGAWTWGATGTARMVLGWRCEGASGGPIYGLVTVNTITNIVAAYIAAQQVLLPPAAGSGTLVFDSHVIEYPVNNATNKYYVQRYESSARSSAAGNVGQTGVAYDKWISGSLVQ